MSIIYRYKFESAAGERLVIESPGGLHIFDDIELIVQSNGALEIYREGKLKSMFNERGWYRWKVERHG